MNDNLLENSQLETYNSTVSIVDNICVICLDYVHSERVLLPVNNSYSDSDSCDCEYVAIEMADINAIKENSSNELWTCDNCNNTYHLKCIYGWAKNKTFKCPTCRQLVRKQSAQFPNIIIITENDENRLGWCETNRTHINACVYLLVVIILIMLTIFIIHYFIPDFQNKLYFN